MPIEWNTISLPMMLTLSASDAFAVQAREVEVRRGAKLVLETVVRATARPERKPDPVLGSPAHGVQVRAATRHREEAILDGYRTHNTSVSSKGDGEYETRIDGRIHAVHIDYRDGECASRYEWLTNVPRRIWSRTTERRNDHQASRHRDDEIITAPGRGGDARER